MYVCMYVHMYECLCVVMFICLYVCIFVCMYVCTFVGPVMLTPSSTPPAFVLDEKDILYLIRYRERERRGKERGERKREWRERGAERCETRGRGTEERRSILVILTYSVHLEPTRWRNFTGTFHKSAPLLVLTN